jgi:hypothetical protein
MTNNSQVKTGPETFLNIQKQWLEGYGKLQESTKSYTLIIHLAVELKKTPNLSTIYISGTI